MSRESPRRRSSTPTIGRVVLATVMVAILYAVLFPGLFLLVTVVLAWETLLWLWVSVLLVPALSALGLIQLLSGLPLIALLVGAIAARWPGLIWPKLVAALMLPLVELALVRRTGLSHMLGRVLPLLMDHRALFVLGTVAPPVASALAALLVPRGLVRRLLGRNARLLEL